MSDRIRLAVWAVRTRYWAVCSPAGRLVLGPFRTFDGAQKAASLLEDRDCDGVPELWPVALEPPWARS